MKTRIISGIVMGIIVAAVLTIGFLWNPIAITLAVALLAAGAVYELLHNAAGIKCKAAWIGGCVFAFLNILLSDFNCIQYFISAVLSLDSIKAVTVVSKIKLAIAILYLVYSAVMTLRNHKDFGLSQIAALCGLPLFFSQMFIYLHSVIINENGIYYLLLLLNFSSVCDMGAYFVGVTCGKHKLCPNISPKKTVEGAVGGIVSSMVVTVILGLCFSKSLIIPMILTIPFCILGMIGDLFASAIKRSVGLKDYSNLIPGHGGVLDRTDSIIMIAPLLYLCITLGVI